MAGLMFSPETRGQFAAIVVLRWQLFSNSLRTLRGRFELVTNIFVFLTFLVLGCGGALGMAIGAWHFTSSHNAEWLAGLFWPAFIWWQLFPVLGSAFAEVSDASNLLRFPLSYPAYFFVRIAYGSVDPYTLVVLLWLTGIFAGVSLAAPALSLWAALVLLVFAAFNILLSRAIFAWIERWLARRRSREIVGLIFFLFIISIQFIGPVISHLDRHRPSAGSDVTRTLNILLPIERALPPGLAALSISQVSSGDYLPAIRNFVFLAAFAVVCLWFLNARLRAQFLGENLSEAAVPRKTAPASAPLLPGAAAVRPLPLAWSLPGFSAPISAIFEKEIRYLLRSGPALFTLFMPVVILLIFRFTAATPGHGGAGFLNRMPSLAFPIGAAYSVLILSNLVFNNFGGDAVGVQLYFAAPIRLREVLLAKNLAHTAVTAFEMVVLWAGVCFLFGCPSPQIVIATLAAMLWALPVDFALGNLLSIYSPRRIDMGAFGRQKPSSAAQFASLGSTAVIFGIPAVILIASSAFGLAWPAAICFSTVVILFLAAIAIVLYFVLLARTEKMALDRREVLIAELSKV